MALTNFSIRCIRAKYSLYRKFTVSIAKYGPTKQLAVRVAQSVERPAFNRVVAGSIPATGGSSINAMYGQPFCLSQCKQFLLCNPYIFATMMTCNILLDVGQCTSVHTI
jgi:hypothetical protein